MRHLKRPTTPPDVLVQHSELTNGDFIAFDRVSLCEIGTHVLDELARDGRRHSNCFRGMGRI